MMLSRIQLSPSLARIFFFSVVFHLQLTCFLQCGDLRSQSKGAKGWRQESGGNVAESDESLCVTAVYRTPSLC